MPALDDKNATMQVIGSLMKSPLLLVDNNYILTKRENFSLFLTIKIIFKLKLRIIITKMPHIILYLKK